MFRMRAIKTLFSSTAAAHGIRDAEREFPSEHDFVLIPIYEPVAESAEARPVEKLRAAEEGVRHE